jgi:hypothetical protein
MPIGVAQGKVITVVAQFFDSAGVPVLPPVGAVLLNVSYKPAVGGSSIVSSLFMSPVGESWKVNWSSSAAALGQAVLSFTAGSVTLSPPDPILLINQNT